MDKYRYSLFSITNTGTMVIKNVSCSTKLSMKFQLLIKNKMLNNNDFSCSDVEFILLINVKMPTIVGIF